MITIVKNLFLLLSFLLISQTSLKAQFNSAESAEYDPTENRWLVSNGNIVAIAADGSSSTFGNAQGGFGLEVMNTELFAIGSDGTIRGYNLADAALVMTLSIPGSSFLNGMTSNGVDKLWVTDFGADKIIEIDVSDLTAPTFTTIASNTLTTPNGIVLDADNNRLLYTSWSSSNAKIRAVDLTDHSISEVVTTTVGRIDGIDDDALGNYYISSWSPARITKYDKNFVEAPVTITTPFISAPADIGYSQVTDTLAIPIGNNVVFVGFEDVVSSKDIENDFFNINVFPNPIQSNSTVQFTLAQPADVELSIYDLDGKRITELLNGKQNSGKHFIAFAGHQFPAGQYVLVLKAGTRVASHPLIFMK